MNIFNKLTIASLSAVVLLSGGCNSSEPESKSTFQIKMNNLVIPFDRTKDVEVQTQVQYSFMLDFVKSTMTLIGNDVKANGTSYSFTSEPMPMQYLTSDGYWTAYFNNGQANAGNFTSVLDIKGYLTSIVFYYRPTVEQIFADITRPHVVLSYTLQGNQIKTFASNSYFVGRTETTYPSQEGMQSFTNDDMMYRVYLNADMKTADVVLYRAKFAPQMKNPIDAIYLEKLPVTFDRNGYSITGTDIIPLASEGASTTPHPEYEFNSIEIKTVDSDLTKIDCHYTVKSIFKGSFSGHCIDAIAND